MGLILCVIFIAVGHQVDSVTEATSCLQHGRTIEILTVCLWTRPPLTMYFGKIPIQLCGQACLHCRLASACVWGGASVLFLLCTHDGDLNRLDVGRRFPTAAIIVREVGSRA